MKQFSHHKLTDSTRKAFFYFLDKYKPNRDFKILSVSCGDGVYEKLIFENYPEANLTGTDVVDCFVPKKDLEFFQKSGTWNFVKVFPEKELPFSDSAFDLVFHNDVIEHVEKPFLFLQEQLRVLKPGGGIILTTPNLLRLANVGKILLGQLDFPKKIHYDDLYTTAHHQQEFTEWNIVGMLKEVGFSEIEVRCSFWGLHFLNVQFKAHPQKGMGRLMSHYLTFHAKKPKN
jgi:2-polyprenyl-3-methyl-5-hydroxy-6-metoxy-1,4-benzoquinol methylase